MNTPYPASLNQSVFGFLTSAREHTGLYKARATIPTYIGITLHLIALVRIVDMITSTLQVRRAHITGPRKSPSRSLQLYLKRNPDQ